jgi:hypothetical protein
MDNKIDGAEEAWFSAWVKMLNGSTGDWGLLSELPMGLIAKGCAYSMIKLTLLSSNSPFTQVSYSAARNLR